MNVKISVHLRQFFNLMNLNQSDSVPLHTSYFELLKDFFLVFLTLIQVGNVNYCVFTSKYSIHSVLCALNNVIFIYFNSVQLII